MKLCLVALGLATAALAQTKSPELALNIPAKSVLTTSQTYEVLPGKYNTLLGKVVVASSQDVGKQYTSQGCWADGCPFTEVVTEHRTTLWCYWRHVPSQSNRSLGPQKFTVQATKPGTTPADYASPWDASSELPVLDLLLTTDGGTRLVVECALWKTIVPPGGGEETGWDRVPVNQITVADLRKLVAVDLAPPEPIH